jgi:hypothetical protein
MHLGEDKEHVLRKGQKDEERDVCVHVSAQNTQAVVISPDLLPVVATLKLFGVSKKERRSWRAYALLLGNVASDLFKAQSQTDTNCDNK